MQTTNRSRAIDLTGAIALILGLVVSMLALLAAPSYAADATVSGPTTATPVLNGGICAAGNGFGNRDDIGSSLSVSGDWGSLSANTSDAFATANVKAGWSVDLCVKAGPGNNVYTVTCPPGESPDDDCDAVKLDSPKDSVSHIAAGTPRFTEPEEAQTVRVCEVATGDIIEVDEDQADNEGYASVDDPACDDQEPQTVRVCEVATGNIIEVDEDQADNEGYASVDDPACDSPETATATAWVCAGDGAEELVGADAIAAATEAGLTLYDSEDDADLNCTPEAASAWVCVDNEAVELLGQEAIDQAEIDGLEVRETRPEDCQAVLGAGEERDVDSAAETDDEDQLPATEVKGEQVASGELPNTGSEHVLLGLLAGGFLMLGGSMLLLGDRRRGVLA